MLDVENEEANEVLNWLLEKGMKFSWGTDPKESLQKNKHWSNVKCTLLRYGWRMILVVATIGIQYQQGLKDICAASDLVEGLLNNTDRPPVFSKDGRELFAKVALPHFNEVDECAGLDGLITYRLWQQLGMNGENTLHDLRGGNIIRGMT
jgi:hypothetical protein